MEIEVNLEELKNIRSEDDAKEKMTNSNPTVSKEMLASLQNSFNYMNSKSDLYESCLWIESNQNLLANKSKTSNKKYKEKSIVLVDLGIDTFGYEFCYEHPCVVLYNEYNKVFVVPCTSKPPRVNKKGKLYSGQLVGDVADGFSKKTTIRLNEAKFIDKVRIKSCIGKVEDELFNEIYNEVFGLIFENKRYEIKKLEEKLKDSEKKYELLQEKLSIIQQENEMLNEELAYVKLVAATEVSDSE